MLACGKKESDSNFPSTGKASINCCHQDGTEERLWKLGLLSLGKRWLGGTPKCRLLVPTGKSSRRWSHWCMVG